MRNIRRSFGAWLLTIFVPGVAFGDAPVADTNAVFTPNAGDVTYYFAGATGSAQFIRNRIIDETCVEKAGQGGSEITVFEVDRDDYIIVCDLKAAVGSGSARFIKQSGGSGDGTTSVSQPNSTLIDYAIPAANYDPVAGCAAPQAVETGAETDFVLFPGCIIPSVPFAGADIGTTDVEASLFFRGNTPSAGLPFTAADAAQIDTAALAGLGFGIAVTKSLREALQALQFPQTSACHPVHPSHQEIILDPNGPTFNPNDTAVDNRADIDGDGNDDALFVGAVAAGSVLPAALSASINTARVADTEPCMPNFSRSEITGLFGPNGIGSWTQIQNEGVNLVEAATAAGVSVPPENTQVPLLNDRRIHICRRNPGSGTNAQFQVQFFNEPCANVNGIPVSDAALGASPNTCDFFATGKVVCMNRSSSDLGRCLNALEENELTGNAAELFDNNDASPLNDTRFAWAVGYQSLEKNTGLERGWRFVKIGGFAPTLQNVYAADYMNHYEQICQIRKDNSTRDPNDSEPSATLRNIFDAVCSAGPVDVARQNLSFLQPFGPAGWLAVPGMTGMPPQPPLTAASVMDPNDPMPINSWTRRGSSCRAPIVVAPVQSQ